MLHDPPDSDDFRSARLRMIDAIERHMHETVAVTGEASLEPRVREALEAVPRHAFVPEALQDRAYDDQALPIGSGQTISQPFIVALMTQLAHPAPGTRCLEIGTGCGYQAAVLARIAGHVRTIELVPELAAQAASTLERLGIDDVEIRVGDGHHGWPEAAPFDAILVTAGGDSVPSALLDQLAPNGRLVLPLSTSLGVQELTVVTHGSQGEITTRAGLPVAFVPFVRAADAPPGEPLG